MHKLRSHNKRQKAKKDADHKMTDYFKKRRKTLRAKKKGFSDDQEEKKRGESYAKVAY